MVVEFLDRRKGRGTAIQSSAKLELYCLNRLDTTCHVCVNVIGQFRLTLAFSTKNDFHDSFTLGIFICSNKTKIILMYRTHHELLISLTDGRIDYWFTSDDFNNMME
jgi:hypothetical protein